MNGIAFAIPFTEYGLKGASGIDPRWIVHDRNFHADGPKAH
jgi:hypothetical protein